MKYKNEITFQPMGVSMECRPGLTVLQHAVEANVRLRAECGGRGQCGKCLVVVRSPQAFDAPTEEEIALLGRAGLDSGLRLACRAIPDGPAEIEVPPASLEAGEAIGKSGIYGPYPVNPIVRRLLAPAPDAGAAREDPAQDAASIFNRRASVERVALPMDLSALRQIDRTDALCSDWTLVESNRERIISAWPGRAARSLGLAVDLGTTTIAAYLCDLNTGLVEASAAAANPQRRHGEDVISRILFARPETDGLRTLKDLAVKAIDDLLTECLAKAGARRQDVDDVVVCGNTTMQHILLGINPASLGVSPYRPVFRYAEGLRAATLGLNLPDGVGVHVFPVISGFVGGDTTAAIIAARPHQSDEISLVVDMGTNGEVVLGNRRGLWATSCATGPALEGAQLSCGMRAGQGAIDRVDFDPVTRALNYRVIGPIGGAKPAGICGSGILDAVAAMLEAGLVNEGGRMAGSLPERAVVLASADESANGRPVAITQLDIRQIQLAKAALAVGIRFLMQAANVDRVDRLVLTGAFGARFDWRSAAAIGMLPQAVIGGRVETPPNAAGEGAVMALLDKDRRDEALKLAVEVRTVELAELPEFGDALVEATKLKTV